MDYTYNIINSSVCHFDLMHNSQYITVYFVISGRASVHREHQQFNYNAGDLFITIPEMGRFQIESIEGSLVCLTINKIHLSKYYLNNAKKAEKTKKVEKNLKKAFLESVRYTYEKDELMTDFSIIKLINYIHIYYDIINTYLLKIIKNQIVAQAIKHVNMNYKKPLKLSEVANTLFVNSSFLSRKFKEEMNINFNEYVRRIKLYRLAEDLLVIGNEKQLWKDYNFASYRTFIKHFKAQFEMTPSEFVANDTFNMGYENIISDDIYDVTKQYLQSN